MHAQRILARAKIVRYERPAGPWALRLQPPRATSTGYSLGRQRRYLANQLHQNGFGEIVKLAGGYDEGAASAYDIGLVIAVELRLVLENGEAIDRDALRDRLVAREVRQPSAVV